MWYVWAPVYSCETITTIKTMDRAPPAKISLWTCAFIAFCNHSLPVHPQANHWSAVTIDLHFLEFPKSRIIYNVYFLSVTQQIYFEVEPFCCVYPWRCVYCLSYYWEVFHCMNIPRLLIHSAIDGLLGHFRSAAILNKAAVFNVLRNLPHFTCHRQSMRGAGKGPLHNWGLPSFI